MIYLASPYTDPNPQVMDERYEAVLDKAAEFFQRGEFVFSPIVHCHLMAYRHKLPKDISYWNNYNTEMLSLCDELCVLMLPCWENSRGIRFEIELASKLGKRISYVGI